MKTVSLQALRSWAFVSLTILFLLPVQTRALQQNGQQILTYEGKVKDANSKKVLTLASLNVMDSNISTITNSDGEFMLKVPVEFKDNKLVISYLGYKSKVILLSSLKPRGNQILLDIAVTNLTEVNIDAPENAEKLVRQVLRKRDDNYLNSSSLMTAFYRETIKKRRKNVSLSEAVVNIYKTPYNSRAKDVMELYKARKSTDYTKLDTLALKLQGGPFNTLYVDLMKYPEYLFVEGGMEQYNFKFERSTYIDDKPIAVVGFEQKPRIVEPLYKGKLYIDLAKNTLVSAVYQLNITNKRLASKLFVRRKPAKVDVWPNEISYRVDYREKDGKWYYGYSSVLMQFKIDWKGKLFNSVYSLVAEMAVTDWDDNLTGKLPKNRERINTNIILSDEAIGFSDPNFWGEYNIIEPDKSIESAIKKIQRQLRKSAKTNGAIP